MKPYRVLLVVGAGLGLVTVLFAGSASVPLGNSPPVSPGRGDACALNSRLEVLRELARRRLAARFIPAPVGSAPVDLVDDALRNALYAHRLPIADAHWDFFECCVPHAHVAEFRRRFPVAEPNAGRGRIRCDRNREQLMIIPRDTPRATLIEMLETGWVARIAGSHWE